MKKVKILALISAVVTALLLFLFLSSLNKQTDTETTSVLVAAKNIPANTPITEEMLELAQLPAEAVVSGALTDKFEVIGKIANVEIFTGEQLLFAKLASTGETGSPTLAYAIEPGMRAITIGVDEASGLGYMITPGNNVDIIAEFVDSTTTSVDGTTSSQGITYTTMVLENIKVLAVDNIFSEEGKVNSDSPAYTSLTLQVTPEQAMRLSAAQFDGQLRVILRSPVDKEETHQSSITLGEIIVR